jgi:hypothetical protein
MIFENGTSNYISQVAYNNYSFHFQKSFSDLLLLLKLLGYKSKNQRFITQQFLPKASTPIQFRNLTYSKRLKKLPVTASSSPSFKGLQVLLKQSFWELFGSKYSGSNRYNVGLFGANKP